MWQRIFSRPPSLRRILTIRVSLLLLVTLVVITLLAFWNGRATVADLGGRIVRQTAQQVDDRVKALLANAEAQANLLAGFAQTGLGVRTARLSSGQFPELGRQLFEVMRANPEFSSARYIVDATGESISVIRRPNGTLVMQRSDRTGWQTSTYRRQDLVPFGDEMRVIFEDPEATFDPRRTLVYEEVRAQKRSVWGGTDLLKGTVDVTTVGISYAVPLYDNRQNMVGVVMVDLSVGELSRYISRIRVAQNGYAFLVEQRGRQEARIVAYPNLDRLLTTEQGLERLATLDELQDELVTKSLDLLLVAARQEPGTVASGSVRRNGVSHLVGLVSASGAGPPWTIGVVVPEDDFMSGVQRTTSFVLGLGLVALAMGVVLTFWFARRLSRPLGNLVTETERVRKLDLAPRLSEPVGVREIDALAVSVEQMKTGLRSFEKLVPSDYARHLMSSGQEAKLGGERRWIATSFADIIGFTALSERLPAEELVKVLAEYLDLLSDEVIQRQGTVDKFNGDDVMAFWGAPKAVAHPGQLACEAALAGRAVILAMHPEWRRQGRPALRASFGIATGDVIVGNIGSRERMQYTVIGDAVNLASRLQGLNKAYQTEILIDVNTAKEAGPEYLTRCVDYVAVAGREEPIELRELLGRRDDLDAAAIMAVRGYEQGLQLYRERKFAEAVDCLSETLKLWPDDGPSRVLRARAQDYMTAPPPEDWDAVTRFSVK